MDLSHLLALRHSQEGQKTLAKFLVQKYVRRGAYWLNRYAPGGWYRNCLNGGVSRIHTSYGNEGVLGIAFEYCEQFADNTGYIMKGMCFEVLGFGHMHAVVAVLGFMRSIQENFSIKNINISRSPMKWLMRPGLTCSKTHQQNGEFHIDIEQN
jgi:hypothetical protein